MTVVTSFPINNYYIKRSSFLKDPVESSVNATYQSGFGIGFSSKAAIKASIGEFIERMTVSCKPFQYKNEKVPAYDITNDNIIEVPIEKVLLLDPIWIEKNPIMVSDYFNDTSGVGAHFESSHDVLDSAFREFFERQCFIHNWLTCSEGKRIIVGEMCNRYIQDIYNRAFSFFDNISVFDISLDGSLVVALAIATGEFYMSVGLCGHWDVNSAVEGAIREVFQGVVNFRSKYAPPSNVDMEELSISKENILVEDFYSNFTPSILQRKYAYLNSSPIAEKFGFGCRPAQADYFAVLKAIADKLMIRLYLCYIPTLLNRPQIRTARFLSPDGYPHIKADMFDPAQFGISRLHKSGRFPNKGQIIPFA